MARNYNLLLLLGFLGRRDSKVRRSRSRASIAVVVADHSRDPPCAILVLPELSETGNAAAVPTLAGGLHTLWVAEQVNPRFNRAIPLQRVHGQRSGDKIPVHFSANIILHGFHCRLPSQTQPTLI